VSSSEATIGKQWGSNGCLFFFYFVFFFFILYIFLVAFLPCTCGGYG